MATAVHLSGWREQEGKSTEQANQGRLGAARGPDKALRRKSTGLRRRPGAE